MDRVSNIRREMRILLIEMYNLGREEGIEEGRLENARISCEAYNRGADEGYNQAKEEFHVPDL